MDKMSLESANLPLSDSRVFHQIPSPLVNRPQTHSGKRFRSKLAWRPPFGLCCRDALSHKR